MNDKILKETIDDFMKYLNYSCPLEDGMILGSSMRVLILYPLVLSSRNSTSGRCRDMPSCF